MSDKQVIETMQEIGRLLFRRMKGDLSIHEQIALDNWLKEQDPESKQFFEDCSDWDQVQVALSSMYDIDEAAALADVKKKIRLMSQPEQSSTPIVELPGKRSRIKVYRAAAAVLILLAGTAVVFTLNRKKPDISKLPISQRYHNDVAPGGDKAVLELADGNKIVLDNASNGELAKQGLTRIVKLDNGQLAYQASKVRSETVSFNSITTPKGGQYQIVLPDGSKVWLNAASSLRFPTAFTGNERKIELSGEAYFQVVKNASMPFKVVVERSMSAEAGKPNPLEIEVLGTEFNLTAYGDEDNEKITLINGAVKVSTGNEQKELQPNQQASLNKGSSSLNLISDVNIEEIIAWKNGRFQFHDATIESIMRQAGRWYDIEISYDGKINQQFKGTIPRNVNLSTFLQILEATGWVHFRIEAKKVTVTP